MKDSYDLSLLRDKKPKRLNSKKKGNTFERDVCKLLNEAFGTTEFNRAPNSGAYASTHNLPSAYKIYGDLIVPSDFKFTIECKKGYNKASIDELLNYSGIVVNFLDQTIKDAEKAGRIPLLLWKQDRKPILAVTPLEAPLDSFIYFKYPSKNLTYSYYYIYRFKDLLTLDKSFWFNI